MKIGVGLPDLVRNVDPAVIPRWAAEAEEMGFSTLGTPTIARAAREARSCSESSIRT